MARESHENLKLSFTSSDFDPLLALYSTELLPKCRGAKVFNNLGKYVLGLRQSESFKSIGWFPDELGVWPKSEASMQHNRGKLKRKSRALPDSAEYANKDNSSSRNDANHENLKKNKHVKLSCPTEMCKDIVPRFDDSTFKGLFDSEQQDSNSHFDATIYGKLENLPKYTEIAFKTGEKPLNLDWDNVDRKQHSTIQDKLTKIAEKKLPSRDARLPLESRDRSARLKGIMMENDDQGEKLGLKVRKRGNVLQKMEAHQEGPLSILYNCMKKGIRLKVWTRRYKGLRGVCIGYLIAFDKHMNLAMIDVDEIFTLEIRTLSVQEQAEIAKRKKIEKRNRNRLNRIHRSCQMIEDKENAIKETQLRDKQNNDAFHLSVTQESEVCMPSTQPHTLSNAKMLNSKEKIVPCEESEEQKLERDIKNEKSKHNTNSMNNIPEESYLASSKNEKRSETFCTRIDTLGSSCALDVDQIDLAEMIAAEITVEHVNNGNYGRDQTKDDICETSEVNKKGVFEGAIEELENDMKALKTKETEPEKHLLVSDTSRNDRHGVTNSDTCILHPTVNDGTSADFDFDISASSEEEALDVAILNDEEGRVSDSDDEDALTQISCYLTGVQTLPALSSDFVNQEKFKANTIKQEQPSNELSNDMFRCKFSLFRKHMNPSGISKDTGPSSDSSKTIQGTPETFAFDSQSTKLDAARIKKAEGTKSVLDFINKSAGKILSAAKSLEKDTEQSTPTPAATMDDVDSLSNKEHDIELESNQHDRRANSKIIDTSLIDHGGISDRNSLSKDGNSHIGNIMKYRVLPLDLHPRKSYSEIERPNFISTEGQHGVFRDPRLLRMIDTTAELNSETTVSVVDQRPSDPRRLRSRSSSTSLKSDTKDKNVAVLRSNSVELGYHCREKPTIVKQLDVTSTKKQTDPRIRRNLNSSSNSTFSCEKNVKSDTDQSSVGNETGSNSTNPSDKTTVSSGAHVELLRKELITGDSTSKVFSERNVLSSVANLVSEEEGQQGTSEQQHIAVQTGNQESHFFPLARYQAEGEYQIQTDQPSLNAAEQLTQRTLTDKGIPSVGTSDYVAVENTSQVQYNVFRRKGKGTCSVSGNQINASTNISKVPNSTTIEVNSPAENESLTSNSKTRESSKTATASVSEVDNSNADNALARFFQRRSSLNTAKTNIEKKKRFLLHGKAHMDDQMYTNKQQLNKKNTNQNPKKLLTVSAAFDCKKSLPGHVFRRRHVNQLFIRGDNVAMVAYNKPN